MGKNKKKAPQSPTSAAAPAPPFHTAFAGLAALRDALPAGEAPPSAAPSAGEAPEAVAAKVVLRREKKGRGGKTAVRVQGLAGAPEAWAARMKKELGCGALVEGEEVLLLGDLLERAARWLETQGAAKKVVRGN